MFRHRMSGCVPPDDPTYEDRLQAADAAYEERLASLDLSRAGDLLLFFGSDFFHDAPITSIRVADGSGELQMHMTAWIEIDEDGESDLPAEVGFRWCPTPRSCGPRSCATRAWGSICTWTDPRHPSPMPADTVWCGGIVRVRPPEYGLTGCLNG
jgi:hypothetical protein